MSESKPPADVVNAAIQQPLDDNTEPIAARAATAHTLKATELSDPAGKRTRDEADADSDSDAEAVAKKSQRKEKTGNITDASLAAWESHKHSFVEKCVSLLPEGISKGAFTLTLNALIAKPRNNRPTVEQMQFIADGGTWREVSQRLLIIGGFWHHDATPWLDLERTVNGGLALLRNTPQQYVIEQCTSKGFFVFESVSVRRQSLHEMVLEGPKLAGHPFLAAAGEARYMMERHVAVSGLVHVAEDTPFGLPSVGQAVNNELKRIQAETLMRVVVVGGESGVGKTTCAIIAASDKETSGLSTVCVYLTASYDVGGEDTEARNANAAALLLTLTKEAVPVQPSDSPPNIVAVLVVDEVGSCPQIVRSVCSQSFNKRGIASYLGVEHVLFVLVGTGIDALANTIGSHPNTFERSVVSPCPIALKLWMDWFKMDTKAPRPKTLSSF